MSLILTDQLKKSTKGYENLIAGFTGGFAATLACHPIDLLRIRFSANEGKKGRPQYTSYRDAVKSIYNHRGFLAFYQGLTPSLLASSLSWGLYFQICHKIKGQVAHFNIDTELENFVVSGITGAIIQSFTNPIWVAKTRLCLQYENEKKVYTGLVNCVSTIARKEGVKSLYSGFIPGLFGTLHGSFQFSSYEWMKMRRTEYLGLEKDEKLGSLDILAFSVISKILATTATFPYQVLRTRLQDRANVNETLRKLISRTYANEGMAGFYKGLLAGNIKQLPAAVVTYWTYENVKYILLDC
uniref:Mitochondrial carrier protein n=1 Tax=Rhabditophanes sp. KR3021 TaxID=114890 RepID=A0AC35UCX3_9BILA